jgi:hypothetical protein
MTSLCADLSAESRFVEQERSPQVAVATDDDAMWQWVKNLTLFVSFNTLALTSQPSAFISSTPLLPPPTPGSFYQPFQTCCRRNSYSKNPLQQALAVSKFD